MNIHQMMVLSLALSCSLLTPLAYAAHSGAGGTVHPGATAAPRGASAGAPFKGGGGGGARYYGGVGGGGGIGLGLGLGLFTGALIGSEIVAPSYPYYYPVEVQPPIVYSQPLVQMPPQSSSIQAANPTQGIWYFCETTQSYYPYVGSCSVPWRMVPALPPAPMPSVATPQ